MIFFGNQRRTTAEGTEDIRLYLLHIGLHDACHFVQSNLAFNPTLKLSYFNLMPRTEFGEMRVNKQDGRIRRTIAVVHGEIRIT